MKQKKQTVRGRKVKSMDLAAFCWQLSTMLEGGVPITTAIETIADDLDNAYLGKALKGIGEELQRGEPLSECMKQFPKIFDSLFCAMVMAGESVMVKVSTVTSSLPTERQTV